MYRIFGYYICEFIKIPQGLNRTGSMISVSECFGATHPRLDTCFFLNHYITAQERDAYKKLWNLTVEKTTLLTNKICSLLEKGLAVDGRFTRLSDARYFYDSFFSGGNCILVSVSTEEKYWEILKEEWSDGDCGEQSLTTDYEDQNDLLGYDILGWDIGGFHTFLCNGLEKMLPTASFNSYELLENTFKTVQKLHPEPIEQGRFIFPYSPRGARAALQQTSLRAPVHIKRVRKPSP